MPHRAAFMERIGEDVTPFKCRFHATLREISVAFDAETHVELKLEIDRECPYEGEIRIRIAASEAHNFTVGDYFSFKLTKVD